MITFGQAAAPQVDPTSTPVGRWQTVDDVTGKPKSIVSIWEDSGKLYGKIEQILNPDPDNPEHICKHCQGDLKDKPEIGLRILWDMNKDGEQWSGGKILDPHNGKIYRCSLSLEDGGKKLKVRGFIGISLLGRTQYWTRQE
jgi:uncharacterized protein (DUF2147 family)